ncbi:epithelial-stromal interaction protein 1 [Eublepharis macularius]|uniref:Epithelial-stromal interaction protein 1 n=1 Tax=Eublepharis macularius TaxID=481883 RepID=A0AA97J0J8_EUBMA|nr:epithelial-stromal interaction protein 1 [Eublepharis macularius]
MSRGGAGRYGRGLAAASPSAAPSGGLEGGGVPGPEEEPAHQPPQDAYVVIPPNLARRDQLQRIANKELEELEKWKEQHRPGRINLIPQKLGGRASEAEVRRKQQLEHFQSKYQQKLKKEDYGRRKREAEEAELLKKKALQREKAEKLEEKRRQEQWQRRQMFDEDNYVKTTEYLNKLALGPCKRTSCQTEGRGLESTPWARSRTYKEIQRQEEDRKLQEMKEEQRRKAEILELKQRQEERTRVKAHQSNQQRVNNAFLDRLQHSHQPGGPCLPEGLGNMDFSADGWEPHYFL